MAVLLLYILYLLALLLENNHTNAVAVNVTNKIDFNKSCQNGLLFKEGESSRIFKDKVTSIVVANASWTGSIEILLVKNDIRCCPVVWLEDCSTTYRYNLTLCNRTRKITVNVDRVSVPGNSYIFSLSRNDSCNTTVGLVLLKTGSKTGSVPITQLFSSHEPSTSISSLDLTPTIPTVSLTSTSPLNYSQNESVVTATVHIQPSKVNLTISAMSTSMDDTVSKAIRPSTTLAPTVSSRSDKAKKKKMETIALGITIAVFAVAVLVMLIMIARVIYKTKKDVHVKADDAVFCSNDYAHSSGFVNEVSSSVTKPNFINIRKVSDSDTDEMREVEHHVSYQNKTYGEAYLGGSSQNERQYRDKKCEGISSYKKYPAPHPSKASNYVSNKNTRLHSHKAGRDYFEYKR